MSLDDEIERRRLRKKRSASEHYQKNKKRYMELSKRWRRENPEKAEEIRNRWKHRNPERQLLYRAKVRATRQYLVPFDLLPEDISIPEHCPILGIKLQWYGKRTPMKDHLASLDRIIPELGYVRGNVHVISWRANRLKSDGKLEEFEKIVSYWRKISKK